MIIAKREEGYIKDCYRNECDSAFFYDSKRAVSVEDEQYCSLYCLCLNRFGKTPAEIRRLINIENG